MSQAKKSFFSYKEVPSGLSSNSSSPSERQYENAPVLTSPTHGGGMHNPKYQSTTWRPAYLLILGTLILPFPFLVWSGFMRNSGMLGASTIGGQLTYTQAKAVDFICGAVLAPLLMVLLDYLWFSNARVSVVNEQHSKTGVSLTTLITASTTASGSFDLIRLRDLLRGGTGRLSLLALLVVLSGVASKMLANFVAYEAFLVNVPDAQPATPLRLMTFTYLDPLSDNLEDASDAQTNELSEKWSTLLNTIDYEDVVSKLSDGAYIGINATDASFAALPDNIVALNDIPAYRLTVDCQPVQPNKLQGFQDNDTTEYIGGAAYDLTTNIPCNDKQQDTCGSYEALIPGHLYMESDTDAPLEMIQYAAFLSNNTYAYLGILANQDVSDFSFGDVHGKEFDMSKQDNSGFTGSSAVVTIWGISCKISRQEGIVNYWRYNESWEIFSSSFSDHKTVWPSPIGTFQEYFPYTAPAAKNPGAAPALAWAATFYSQEDENGTLAINDIDVDWTRYQLNYLYASGELERQAYEVATQNISHASHFQNVTATALVQRYQITYIPLLLYLGLAAIICAALITGSIALYTKDAHSSRTDRDVTTLRLLVDSVAGLQSSAAHAADAANLSQQELVKWADNYRVRYTQVVEGGDIVIRLQKDPGYVG